MDARFEALSGQTSTPEATLCLYHNDPDGRCSAAIVRRALGRPVTLYPMDYGDSVPWASVESAGRIVMVDFALPLSDMLRILQTAELTWIDHHKTSLEGLANLGRIPGLRQEGQAACVLSWRTFFPYQTIPRAVGYIGNGDIQRFKHPETAAFHEGLLLEDSRPENDHLWNRLLDDDHGLIERLIATGRPQVRARRTSIEAHLKQAAYKVQFEGYKALVANMRGSGELAELANQRGCDLAYCYYDNVQNGALRTFVTLYSEHVDVSEIAKRFGGGGHPGASGFSFLRRDGPFPPGSQIQRLNGFIPYPTSNGHHGS